MSITISGQNNNDKILASDGVLDQISGFNVVGVLTTGSLDVTNFDANHINVGSNIQLGNAGIITATTLIGNVTGNVNATSNLLLQVGGSEKFRVASSGQLGIGGANYGTSGQVLTSGGSGSAATWSTISGTTINNNADNRIITGSGTANTLNGESNLTFDGTNLTIVSPDISVGTGATISSLGNVTAGIATFAGGVTFKGSNGTLHWRMKPSGSFEPQFNNFFNIGDTYYNVNNVYTKNLVLSEDIIHNLDTNTKISFPAADTISFTTAGSERLRMTSDGKIGIGIASPTFAAGGGVHLKGGNEFTSYRVTANTNTGVDFAQDAAGNGYVYNRDNADLTLGTNNAQRVRINNNGAIGLGGANYGSSGQVLTSQGSGSAVTWSTITGTTINNQSDNRMITCTGTSNTLNAEQYLTYSSQSSLNLTDGNGTSYLGGNYLNLKRSSGNTNYINAPLADAELVISADEDIIFRTVHTADFNSTERVRITSGGKLTMSSGTVELQQHMIRVGNRTTAQINAGISTATGSLTLDTTDNVLKYYANAQWKTVKQQGNDGSTQSLAARSAKALLDAGITTNGVYWLDMHGAYSLGNAKRHYCLMDTSYDGGGWTMLYSMNHGNNFASGSNYSFSVNVGNPVTVSDFTAGNWGYDRRNTFLPAANDQFLIRRSDNNDWKRFVVTTWSPTANSVSNGWETLNRTDGGSTGHPYWALGQMYDSSGNSVSNHIHFNGCAKGGNCNSGGGDGSGFGEYSQWLNGEGHSSYGGAYNSQSNGGSPLYWGQGNNLSQGGSLYIQMFYRKAGTQ